VACAFILLLLFRNMWLMLGALALTQIVLWSARIAQARIAWIWRTVLPTMVAISLLWVVFYPDEGRAMIAWRFVRIGPRNLAEGLAVAFRIGALAFTVFAWLFSTDQASLVRGLVALGLPYEWGLTLAMGLRYLPTMAGVFGMIRDAQQARALDLSKGGPVRRVRALVPIVVAMLITALRMAQNLAHALESRALGATPQRTYLRRLDFGLRDWLLTVSALLLTIAMVWARFALGLGVDPLRLLLP
jgi:energy-coupling factor transport system permease protein